MLGANRKPHPFEHALLDGGLTAELRGVGIVQRNQARLVTLQRTWLVVIAGPPALPDVLCGRQCLQASAQLGTANGTSELPASAAASACASRAASWSPRERQIAARASHAS